MRHLNACEQSMLVIWCVWLSRFVILNDLMKSYSNWASPFRISAIRFYWDANHMIVMAIFLVQKKNITFIDWNHANQMAMALRRNGYHSQEPFWFRRLWRFICELCKFKSTSKIWNFSKDSACHSIFFLFQNKTRFSSNVLTILFKWRWVGNKLSTL